MTVQMANVNRQKNQFTLLVLLFVILASATLPADPHLTLFPCLFKSTFHVPCPGCGMTRAFILLGHFRFQEALNMNINSIFAYMILLTITMNEIIVLAIGKKINLPLSKSLIVLIFTVGFCAMMAGWYYNLTTEGFIQ